MNKKISIIIPCYKYAHYLKECIESVRKQTYPNIEVIVVSDGSPDNTMEVAKELGVTAYEKPNGGLSSARNYGIERATGEFIMCLDADDRLTPGAIEEHMALIEDDTTLAQCALMEFQDRHNCFLPSKESGLVRVMQANSIFCNAVFSKKLWEKVGGFDEGETIRLGYEDWEFWIRCLAAGANLRTSDYIALRYRIHGKNMTSETSHPNAQKLYRYIYDKHRALYNEHGVKVAGMI